MPQSNLILYPDDSKSYHMLRHKTWRCTYCGTEFNAEIDEPILDSNDENEVCNSCVSFVA